ncbi:hypothetical protein TW95_gp0225 [Pandoravirus inopinatum]|uniref:Uncharacterized protein n=1 Tax=Pandoravirus inopinatum TaxID=1605721 RepID=A0A0B5J0G2_9VIRU|nr:hypothetical protein TW95_gp0225 [Pandoravirus inopinatum]AJF96959.1 hypothetical protein [Pandoravirus inopinatum]
MGSRVAVLARHDVGACASRAAPKLSGDCPWLQATAPLGRGRAKEGPSWLTVHIAIGQLVEDGDYLSPLGPDLPTKNAAPPYIPAVGKGILQIGRRPTIVRGGAMRWASRHRAAGTLVRHCKQDGVRDFSASPTKRHCTLKGGAGR